MKVWGNNFITLPNTVFKIFTPFHEVFISGISNKVHFIKINQTVKKAYRLIFYLNFVSARDFYENTNLKWYFRTTYDCYVHLPNLYTFIQKLNSQFNPLKDIVMKGDHTGSFVHGGSGWIMSRAAVGQYLNMENEMTKEYETLPVGDDVNILMFTDKFNLTFADIHAPEFAGWPVKEESFEKLVELNFFYDKIKNSCENELQPIRVNSIVVWHNGQKNDYVNTIGRKIIESAPDFVGLHFFKHYGGEFCRLVK